MDTIKFSAFRIAQPIGQFYVATIGAAVLRRLAQADMRRIAEREVESYAGIQRGLNRTRVSEIKKYIETVDSSFPNAIILNLRPEFIVSQAPHEALVCPENTEIICFEVKAEERAFQIIDGQHRLAGFSEENSKNFELLVTVFVDLPVEEQAYLFSTINLTQTKVSKSLVYDLFDVSETRSPQRTAHLVAKALNGEKESPFFQRLKLLGSAPRIDGEVLYRAQLTQGTFVDRLLALITNDPTSDRDLEKRGQRPGITGNEVEEGLIFRPFYLEEKDWAILKVMSSYFSSVAEHFHAEWSDKDNPIARTIGYGALIRLLVILYAEGAQQKDVSKAYFSRRLGGLRAKWLQSGEELSFENFPASGAGEAKLFRSLRKWAQ
jgi:DGQHR domain-containing protein